MLQTPPHVSTVIHVTTSNTATVMAVAFMMDTPNATLHRLIAITSMDIVSPTSVPQILQTTSVCTIRKQRTPAATTAMIAPHAIIASLWEES